MSCVLLLGACAAKPLEDYAFAGIERRIFQWAFWNGRCAATEFDIRIKRAPASGEAVVRDERMTIPRESASGARMACAGRQIAGKSVWYRADEGYEGPDVVGLSVVGPGAAPQNFEIEIDVRR